jgi:hypothetical protein
VARLEFLWGADGVVTAAFLLDPEVCLVDPDEGFVAGLWVVDVELVVAGLVPAVAWAAVLDAAVGLWLPPQPAARPPASSAIARNHFLVGR